MAYADLGGLGLRQGVPVAYDWTAPSLMPQLLPWLGILALLLLKPNRCASAWWIWVPLACVGGVAFVPESVVELLPSAQLEVFLEMIGALGFGLAAVWLLSSYLAWKHRMLVCLGMLLVQGVAGLVVFAIRLAGEGAGMETLQLAVFVAVGGLVMCVALSLAGLVCRGRYGWLRLSLWLIAAVAVVWLLVIGPFFIFVAVANGGNVSLLALLPLVVGATGATLGVLLPFLVLSFANGLYRERLKGLLHLGGVAPPPTIAPLMPAVQGVVGG